jgi:hypothetical protein
MFMLSSLTDMSSRKFPSNAVVMRLPPGRICATHVKHKRSTTDAYTFLKRKFIIAESNEVALIIAASKKLYIYIVLSLLSSRLDINEGPIMKAHNTKSFSALSILAGLLITGTACGASPTVTNNGPIEAAPAADVTNPEMQSAEERVGKAQAQLDLAKRQLSASRSLLKAAEADLKAARADRDSVAMRYAAQGLAEEAGLPVQAGRAVAAPSAPNSPASSSSSATTTPRTQIADRGTVTATTTEVPAPATAVAPPAATATPESMDYSALPQQNESDPPPPLMLR